MIKGFFGNWGGAFADGWRFARALPWLVALMIGIEFVQHAIEVNAGFFSADKTVRKAASMDALRLTFGWAKMAVVWALAFFALRHGVTRDPRETLRPSPTALRRYAGVILFQLIPFMAIVHAGQIMKPLGIPQDQLMNFRAVFGLGQQLLEPLLYLWFVNAALGTAAFGPAGSAWATRWLYFWALLLTFVTRFPFNAAHYGLNTWPAGKGAALLWPALALDAVVVVVMVIVAAAVQLRIARYIAARRGLALLGEGGAV